MREKDIIDRLQMEALGVNVSPNGDNQKTVNRHGIPDLPTVPPMPQRAETPERPLPWKEETPKKGMMQIETINIENDTSKIERNVLTMDMALPKTCDDCPMDLVACTRLYAPENAKRPKGQIPSWCPWRETTVESDKIYNGRREDRT